MFHSRPVHSLMLSSHRFLCLPLRLPPWTVPCRMIVLASRDDRVTCPNHFSLCLFTVVKRSSYGPMAFPILAFTSSLVMWSLYEIPRSLRKHLISSACILLSMSAVNKSVMVHVSHAYKNMDMARERISLILELMAMFLSFQMTFSLVTAAVVWAILDSTSGLDPSSDTIAPRYLKLRTVSSFSFILLAESWTDERGEETRVPRESPWRWASENHPKFSIFLNGNWYIVETCWSDQPYAHFILFSWYSREKSCLGDFTGMGVGWRGRGRSPPACLWMLIKCSHSNWYDDRQLKTTV